jgi:lincosamide nucleotidyltransferase
MGKPDQLLQRLDDIGAALASTDKALALIGIGSADVELDRLDIYSDLDFFVAVKDGHKAEFIANLDWLSRARPIFFAFKNTPDGYKVLFDDDIYAEFAVFELRELEAATYTEGRIAWKDDVFEGRQRYLHERRGPLDNRYTSFNVRACATACIRLSAPSLR